MLALNGEPAVRPLPDAVCIGASKCGTTSLRYYLHAHPEMEKIETFAGRQFQGWLT